VNCGLASRFRHSQQRRGNQDARRPFLNILRNGLPSGHNLQLQWAMSITGHRWGTFIIIGVFGGLPLKHFDVGSDPSISKSSFRLHQRPFTYSREASFPRRRHGSGRFVCL
jgi:hypothetical protein